MAGRIRRKPHTQIGQKGKGRGRPKGPGAGGGRSIRPQRQPTYQTPGLPLEVGQFPTNPPAVPNFLPNTAAFERGQSIANDALALAGQQYTTTTGLIGPQLEMQRARLGTDMGVATDRLKEDLAGRGVYSAGRPGDTMTPAGAGIGASLYGRNVATPFGRAEQDLASGAAQQYSDAAMRYAESQLGYGREMNDLYNQRAYDAYDMGLMSMPIGGYEVPDMPGPMMTQPLRGGGGGGGGRRWSDTHNRKPAGKTRRKGK